MLFFLSRLQRKIIVNTIGVCVYIILALSEAERCATFDFVVVVPIIYRFAWRFVFLVFDGARERGFSLFHVPCNPRIIVCASVVFATDKTPFCVCTKTHHLHNAQIHTKLASYCNCNCSCGIENTHKKIEIEF